MQKKGIKGAPVAREIATGAMGVKAGLPKKSTKTITDQRNGKEILEPVEALRIVASVNSIYFTPSSKVV